MAVAFGLVGTAVETAKGGTSSGDVLSWIANAIVVVAAGIVLWRWLRWRDWSLLRQHPDWKAVWRWLKPKGPISVSYQLPKQQYHESRFEGAPAKESTSRDLTIGIGTYAVTVRIDAHTEVTLEQVRIAIDESTGIGRRPRHMGIVPSRLARQASNDYRGKPRYVDWNGELRVAEDFMSYPRLVAKNDHVLVTLKVRAEDEWDGKLVVGVLVRGYFTRSQTVRLPLRVSAYNDQVPYLSIPDRTATLTAAYVSPSRTLLALGFDNDTPHDITNAYLNFRVPNYVTALVPVDQYGNEITPRPGYLMNASETLADEEGNACGDGIKYWARADIAFKAELSSLLYFRVDMDPPRPLPVRVTLGAPGSFDAPIQIAATFHPETASEE